MVRINREFGTDASLVCARADLATICLSSKYETERIKNDGFTRTQKIYAIRAFARHCPEKIIGFFSTAGLQKKEYKLAVLSELSRMIEFGNDHQLLLVELSEDSDDLVGRQARELLTAKDGNYETTD